MAKRGENKFGLKVEDFPSYEDYRKECKRLAKIAWGKANPEKISAKNKAYREANKEKLKATKKIYYQINKEEIKAKAKVYREDNPEKIRAYRDANKEKLKAYDEVWRKANPEKIKAWREANKAKTRDRGKAWREANPEKEKAKSKAYYEANKEKVNARTNAWAKNNKGLVTAKTIKRKLAKLKRTPNWSNLDKIEQFYIDCPKGYEVDHIIPLQGKLVSGLHVLENLQYLTPKENRSKGHSFDIEDQEKYF